MWVSRGVFFCIHNKSIAENGGNYSAYIRNGNYVYTSSGTLRRRELIRGSGIAYFVAENTLCEKPTRHATRLLLMTGGREGEKAAVLLKLEGSTPAARCFAGGSSSGFRRDVKRFVSRRR